MPYHSADSFLVAISFEWKGFRSNEPTVRSHYEQKSKPGEVFSTHDRVLVDSSITGLLHAVFDFVPGINRFGPRARSAHVAKFRYAAPSIQNLACLVECQDRRLVVTLRM